MLSLLQINIWILFGIFYSIFHSICSSGNSHPLTSCPLWKNSYKPRIIPRIFSNGCSCYVTEHVNTFGGSCPLMHTITHSCLQLVLRHSDWQGRCSNAFCPENTASRALLYSHPLLPVASSGFELAGALWTEFGFSLKTFDNYAMPQSEHGLIWKKKRKRHKLCCFLWQTRRQRHNICKRYCFRSVFIYVPMSHAVLSFIFS